MGRAFSRPERMRMFMKQYLKEMSSLGVNSIGIVLLISFFIGAVICIQIKLNIQSPWMPRFVTGYVTREIMLLDLTKSDLILSPYFYLQQNDILYVTPNKTKAKNSDIGNTTTTVISATSILVSIASLLVNILR